MRRFFTFIAAISMVIGAMAQSPGITLSTDDGKKLQFFASDQLAQAIEAAQPNDTIYFAVGSYSLRSLPIYNNDSYKRLISKPLTFIGAGAEESGTMFNTESSGYDIIIDLSGFEADKNISFEGIRFNNNMDIRVKSDMNLILRNCYISGDLRSDINADEGITLNSVSIVVDRCNVNSVDLGLGIVASATFKNSYVRDRILRYCVNNQSGATLANCCIRYVDSSFNGYVLNSFVGTIYSNAAMFENCYYNYNYTNTNINGTNNQVLTGGNNWNDCNDDPKGSLAAGYVGKDGTVAGTFGGDAPYSLNPSYPTPDAQNSTVEYDVNNKKLNITVSILGSPKEEEPTPASAE